MATRDDIETELLSGATPYRLSKKYPRASVYRVYNELIQSGQLTSAEVIHAEDLGKESGSGYPFEPVPPTPGQPMQTVTEKEDAPPGKTGAEVLDFTGPKGLPIEAINRIRGVLGISLRPKVLSMPTPELLYPAMVISVTELGFPAMRPDDFIDTILYQWLDACDIVPYAFMKKSELEELAKKYSATEEAVKDKAEEAIKDEKFRSEHNLVTTDEIREAVFEPLAEKEREAAEEAAKEKSGELREFEQELEPDEEVRIPLPTDEQITSYEKQQREDRGEPEPEQELPEPTVGELLNCLHISNVQKIIQKGENDVSAGRTESNNSQNQHEPGE